MIMPERNENEGEMLSVKENDIEKALMLESVRNATCL